MAEIRKFTESVLGASDEIYDYNCSPCEESGVYKEAHKYCDNCKLYYCKKCLGDHNKFPALRGHLIKDVTSQPKPAVPTGAPVVSVPAPPVEPCDNHPEEMIKMYCGEHDVVCCTVCIALDHRECKDVHYILNLAKNIRKKQEYIDYVEEVKRIKTVYEETKQSIQDEMKKMSEVKTEIINEIKEYKRELVSRIEELERKSLENVNERYKQITEKLNATASRVDELLDKVGCLLREMDVTSEVQLFVSMKKLRLTKDGKAEIDEGIKSFEGLSFSLDRNIRNALDNADGLATVNIPFKILSRKEYNIGFDNAPYFMYGTIILDDGTLVMTCINGLKRFSISFCKLQNISVPGELWGICKTSRLNELAIAIRDKERIQFVQYTAKSMSLTKSFAVGVSCKGICCNDDCLFVSCGGGNDDKVPGHIRQYDMAGNLITIVETDANGQLLFTSPRIMAFDSSRKRIQVVDKYNGIIVIDENGKITSQKYSSFLKSGFGLSLTRKSGFIVSGWESFNVQQYDEHYRYIGTVLNFTDEMAIPECILLNDSKKQLIVCLDGYNKFYVYDVEC